MSLGFRVSSRVFEGLIGVIGFRAYRAMPGGV